MSSVTSQQGTARPVPRRPAAQGLDALRRRPLWRRPWVLRLFWQGLLVAVLLLLLDAAIGNFQQRSPGSGLGFGFGFLTSPARFEIGANVLGATGRDPVWMAFAAGLINTLRVALLGIVLCTVLGFVLALARLSDNWLLSRVALLWIETVRNIPLLLQLLFWYALSTLFPRPQDAWTIGESVFVTNRGVYFPTPVADTVLLVALGGLVLAAAATLLLMRAADRRFERTGHRPPAGLMGLGLMVGLPAAILLAGGAQLELSFPEMGRFNFTGGGLITPEFFATLLALSVYQSGFAAETIRSGIQGVRKGQIEAAVSLGLPPRLVLRKVVMPQALRIIIPPMTSQYMSLIKNSSLAVVIGYPELVRVSTAVIAETGRAIECIAILMATYLTLSLLTAAFMNWYNRRKAFMDA